MVMFNNQRVSKVSYDITVKLPQRPSGLIMVDPPKSVDGAPTNINGDWLKGTKIQEHTIDLMGNLWEIYIFNGKSMI